MEQTYQHILHECKMKQSTASDKEKKSKKVEPESIHWKWLFPPPTPKKRIKPL